MSSFSYRLGCAVPSYDNAQALAEGIRLFDEDAFVHIKESQDDDFWEIIALFNLVNGGKLQFAIISLLFANSVKEIGGREL
ncbi:MAG: hypothetical protein CMM27_10655 [Rhodospirillaceae bacterium]|nr:hypothetical protein [Rhodospirillaceae bacterium]|tara:strand:+ start:926 stop:1168 length:243 start_codon:yes stop_codon:yes gene_type:complete